MANNYNYIVAGLPDLLLDFGHVSFDFDRLKAGIKEQLGPKDQRWVEWLDVGLRPDRLSPHFYRAASKAQNSFIRDYFAFDLHMRNILSAVSARKAGREPALSVVGNDDIARALCTSRASDFGLKIQSDLAVRLFSILETENILDREQKLDRLRWDKAAELCTFHYFDIEAILCFLLKLSIVERWIRLDKARGQVLFKALVQEIKTARTEE